MRRFIALGVTMMALTLAGCAATGPAGELQEGWELMVAEDYPAARDHYEGILAENPDNPYAHLNLGVAYHRLGETERARRHYEAAVAHGGEAEITQVADEDGVAPETSTVADQARENLRRMGG